MPDIQNFSITPLAAASVTVPRARVECQIVGDNGQVLADYTGANAIVFPAVLGQLSAKAQRKVLRLLIHSLLRMRAGLEDEG